MNETTDERKAAFLRDFHELCEKHGVEVFFETEDGRAYLDVWPKRTYKNSNGFFEVENSDL